MDKIEARKYNIRVAKRLCEENNCTESQRKEHFDMIVHRAWNPHPSKEFTDWWKTHPHFQEGIDAIRARNCKCYCQEFLQAKEVGAV